MKKFTLTLLLILVSASLIVELFRFLEIINSYLSLYIHLTNLFYFIMTFVLFSLASLGFKKDNPKLFVKIVSMNTFLRLIFSLLFIVIILIFSDVDLMPYVVANILLYFIYMAFEIKYLLPNLRPDSEKAKHVGNAHK